MSDLVSLMRAADEQTSGTLPTVADARRIRNAAGVDATAVAAAVGIAERTLLAYEQGKREPQSGAVQLRLTRVLAYLAERERVA